MLNETFRANTITAVNDWLIGRDAEVGLLRDLVANVTAGNGGAVLVEGEEGIGKTALLRAGLADAATAGCRVAWAAADELGQRFPLGLMTDCLGPQRWSAGPGTGGDGRAAGPLIPAGDPVLAAIEQLLAAVDRWCAVSPVVVVTEDLQWADEASVLAWHRLSRAAEQMPLLVAGSMRPVPVREDLARLRRAVLSRGGSVVPLKPLPAARMADLAGRLAGGQPGPRLTALMDQAGGNPLYARELADALVREGRVRVRGGVAELVGKLARVGMSASLAEMIKGRLGALEEAAVAALRWAAVLGQEFSVTDLEVVTERRAGELMGVVAEAVTAGVIAEAGAQLAFRHGLIRQVLYEGMPQSLRAALHMQAARALAAAGRTPARVAAHLVAAPDLTESWVWDWLIQAVSVLIHQAPQVAAGLLRRALAELADDDPRCEPLEAALVQVAFLLSQLEEVARVGKKMLARGLEPDRQAEVAWLVARAIWRNDQPAEAIDMIRHALATPGVSQTPASRLHVLHALILVPKQPGEAEQITRRVLASAERNGDRFVLGYALHAMAYLNEYRNDSGAALAYGDRALAVLGDDQQTTDLRLLLMKNKLQTLNLMGRHAEAIGMAQDALALTERAGSPRIAAIRTSAAVVYFTAGQWDDALAELESVIGTEAGPPLAHGLAALIAGHRNDPAAADEHLAAVAGISAYQAAFQGYFSGREIFLFLARALAAERADRLEDAVAAIAPCLDPSVAELMPGRYALLPALTRLALAAGHTTTATAAQAAASEAHREPLPGQIAAADYCRGLVQADPAPLLAAADSYRSSGQPLDRAQALEDAAALLAGQDDVDAAHAAFTEALSIYEMLGAEWDIQRAGTRLRRLGIRRGARGTRPRPATGWDALTPTEVRVAHLVADGQSNPDIADQLVLSRNTVQTHVSHILAKLGARSRAEIVREALQHPAAREHAPATSPVTATNDAHRASRLADVSHQAM
jgi:DNA-binding CsgD family transcriptional regulator